MSRLLKCLRKLVEVFDECKAPYAILGGLAIPAYGVPRSTVDVDIGLSISDERKIKEIVRKLKDRKIVMMEEIKPEYTMIYMSDREDLVDIEIWFKPDGIVWKQEILNRRWRVAFKVDGKPLQVYVLSPEDFIVNKLARKDRSARDEEDVVGVMVSSKNKIDRKYLTQRAREEKVFDILMELKEKVSILKR